MKLMELVKRTVVSAKYVRTELIPITHCRVLYLLKILLSRDCASICTIQELFVICMSISFE